jgi:hypothetical protein
VTTLAADRYGMAADSFLSDGSHIRKMIHTPDGIVGFAGDAYYGVALRQWWVDGKRGPPPDQAALAEDDRAELLLLDRNGFRMVNHLGLVLELDGPVATLGTGGDLALGAMLAGADPEAAVVIACERDSSSKLPVHYEALRRRPKR